MCGDGSRHPGAVKQAVDDFAREQGLQVRQGQCRVWESQAPARLCHPHTLTASASSFVLLMGIVKVVMHTLHCVRCAHTTALAVATASDLVSQ